jgi:hypothetical protein
MVERGKDHLGALCVVAAHFAGRFWAVMNRGMPYVICDTDGYAVTPDEATAIIAQQWTVPADVRARRRSKKAGKAPQQVHTAHSRPDARGADTRGDLPPDHRPAPPPTTSNDRTPVSPRESLDNRSSIGDQLRC